MIQYNLSDTDALHRVVDGKRLIMITGPSTLAVGNMFEQTIECGNAFDGVLFPDAIFLPANQAVLVQEYIDHLKDGHPLVIATHSELMFLRVMRNVREGRLKPQDVATLYVQVSFNQTAREGIVWTPLSLSSDGTYSDPWPNGFFPERERELS